MNVRPGMVVTDAQLHACAYSCDRLVIEGIYDDDPHHPFRAIRGPDGRSWAHQGCAADAEHAGRRDQPIGHGDR